MSEESRLAATRDGIALGEDEARELWREFSAHMDANKGDMAGFARLKGWHAVAPEYRQGKAVLLVSTTEAAVAVAKAVAPAAEAVGKPRAKTSGKDGAAPQGKRGAKPKLR